MYCSKCGKENDSGSMFCSSCGAELNTSHSASKTVHKLDRESFLATSEIYKKENKVNKIGIGMTICSILAFIFVLAGMISFEANLLIAGLIFLALDVVVFIPLIVIAGTRAQKFGDKLYAEYLKDDEN